MFSHCDFIHVFNFNHVTAVSMKEAILVFLGSWYLSRTGSFSISVPTLHVVLGKSWHVQRETAVFEMLKHAKLTLCCISLA